MTRKEAIDWFERQIKSMFATQTYIESDKYRAYRMAIEALQTDIVRCGECKWYEQQRVGKSGTCIYGKPIYIVCNDMNFCSFGKRKERR